MERKRDFSFNLSETDNGKEKNTFLFIRNLFILSFIYTKPIILNLLGLLSFFEKGSPLLLM